MNGAPAAGVTWQIDVPGTGTIFANTSANTLDNTNHVPGAPNNDVSMALGFNFILAADEFIVITVNASQTQSSGFSLQQIDPDTPDALYLSATFVIQQREPPAVPEPGIWLLILTGLGLMATRLRRAERPV